VRGVQRNCRSGTAIILGAIPFLTTATFAPWHQEAGPTAFAPFPDDTNYFRDGGQQWMINFRAANLDAMVVQLNAAGISVKIDPEHYPYGRFARLYDPEGNAIERWEPSVD
jgi:glyoxylase I family protein